ncbi:importin-4-like isoform X1 [Arapaima gigas]
MKEDLERFLSQLNEPDSAAVKQATAELKTAFKDPAVIPALSAVMTGSQSTQVRQSAAVMLRMRVMKHWEKISPEHRESLKDDVLQAFQQETEHIVRYSLSQLSAALVKHESPDHWPALLNLINQSTKSMNPQDRQGGLLLLSKLLESNPEAFKPHYQQLLDLFDTVLQDLNNPTTTYYCILSLTAITAYTGPDEQNLMKSLVPRVTVSMKHLMKANQDQASEAMDFFDELMGNDLPAVVPHIAEIVHFCVEMGADTSLSDFIRVKALSFIAFLIKMKNKVILNQDLLSPIIQMVFPVLSATPPPDQEDPEDEEQDGENEYGDSLKHFAALIIEKMALYMPPEKLFQQIVPQMQACLSSQNPYEKKAGLVCMAVLAEGCAHYIRTKMLPSMLHTLCHSLSDKSQIVRSAGLVALGQFSEHLQPHVSFYCADLLPLLLGYMSTLNQTKIVHVTKAFFALENFMENLGAEIEPYLPTLVETMLDTLSSTENLKIKRLVVSSLGAIASAAKQLFAPHFMRVIERVKNFLTDTRDEVKFLQMQSLDSLAVMARTVGKDTFRPIVAECVQLGLNIMSAVDDPEMRRSTYALLSALSTVNPHCLIPHLDTITTAMQLSLKCSKGVTVRLKEETQFSLFDDEKEDADTNLESEKDNDENGSDVAGITVENAYIDEKENACEALGEIALNTGAAFLPFLESSFEYVLQMSKYPHDDVRRGAFTALGQFCRTWHNIWKENPTQENHEALQKILSVVFPSFLEAVRKDRERNVVMAVIDSMNSIIKDCQEEALRSPGRLAEISYAIRDVLKKKVSQKMPQKSPEFEAMLQEFAGEGIPLLGSAVPADTFYPYLNELLPLIMNKAKFSCTVTERAFSVGILAELIQSLDDVPAGRVIAGQLSDQLLPVMVDGVQDSDAGVRNNGVFGLGVLTQVAGPLLTEKYPMLLSLFSSMLEKESDRRVIDNICGALCRMIINNMECVPLDQVLPVILSYLPLKRDLEENYFVFTCLAFLYTRNPSLVVHHLKTVVSVAGCVVGTKDLDKGLTFPIVSIVNWYLFSEFLSKTELAGFAETQNTLLLLLRDLAQNHPEEFQGAVSSLAPEQRTALTAVPTRS